MSECLTTDRILDTAEQVLRRYGLEKTTMKDIAHVLGVTHASLYRYFPSKAALKEAVARRWFQRLAHEHDRMTGVADTESGGVSEQVFKWLDALIRLKWTKLREDPEMFHMYAGLAGEAGYVVREFHGQMIQRLSLLLKKGMESGEFRGDNELDAAEAIFLAIVRFQHPLHHKSWNQPETERQFQLVWRLISSGLLQSPK